MEKCGIYSITNKVNGKVYIGYTGNFHERWCNHKKELRQSIHKNSHLQRAWNNYKEHNFKFERLEICEKQLLVEREDYWCKLLKTHDSNIGYNERDTGIDAVGVRSGIKHTEETKQKISKNRKGKLVGVDNPFYGRTHTDEWKLNESIRRKGKSNTKLIGRKQSDEHRKKSRESHMGHKWTEETRIKVKEQKRNDPKVKMSMAYALSKKYRPVVQLSKEGEFIKEYDTTKEAAISVSGDKGSIGRCCMKNNNHKLTKGYHWMYKEEYYEISKEGGYHESIYIRKNIGL